MSRPDPHAPSGPARIYVYGLIRLADDDGSRLPLGIDGAPVHIVAEGEFGALSSCLPGDLDKEMLDPDAAKNAVLAHHGVLQAASDRETVLPLRFGTVFSDDAGIRTALAAHHGVLAAALQHLQGSREWGVKIFVDRDVLSRGLSSPALIDAEQELAEAPQGKSFFLKRRIAEMRDAESERAIAHDLASIRLQLCEASRGEAAMNCQTAAVTGRSDDMVWNGAYLVARSAEAHFFAVVRCLEEMFEARGYHCAINGPWPPFNFADCNLEA